MSVIKQGILGAGSGKVGGVIMSSWKGIATIRSMPSTVENPNTAAQQTQRGKFSQAVQTARILLPDLIRPYWDPYVKGMSGYNAFIKANINCFDSNGLVTPTAFQASRGIIVGVEFDGISSSPTNDTVTFHWVDNSGVGDAYETDLFVGVVYNQTQGYWKVFTTSSWRMSETVDVPDTRVKSGDIVHCYGFFRRADGSRISDSSYDVCIVES